MRKWIVLLALIVAGLNLGVANANIISGKDDRVPRKAGDVPDTVEKAQGRIICVNGKTNFAKYPPHNRHDLMHPHGSGWFRFEIATATLAFADDTAVVSRHVFMSKERKTITDPRSCWFESATTGQIVPIDGAEYPAFLKDSDAEPSEMESFKVASTVEQDFAVVHLHAKPKDMAGIEQKNILTRYTMVLYKNDPLTIVANYANNFGKGDAAHYTPTSTKCEVKALYRTFLKSFSGPSNVISTDCDIGHGTSGSSVWSVLHGDWYWIGVASDEVGDKKAPPQWDETKNNTLITSFDTSLRAAYDKLRLRFPNNTDAAAK